MSAGQGVSNEAEPVGLLLVFFAAILWGLVGVFTAGLLRVGMGAIEIAFWRALLAGTAFGLHAFVVGNVPRFEVRSALGTVTFAGIGVTLFYVAMAKAVDTGGISLAFILLYTAPAWVTLLAGPLLGERAGVLQWSLVALAMLGVAFVSLAQGEGVTPTPVAVAWGLASGLGYASYYLLGKRLLAERSPELLYGVVLPLGALGMTPFVSWSAKPPEAWLLLAGLAIVSTYLAYLLYGLGLKRARASRAVLVATIEPVVAILFAWVLFGERFGLLGWVGAALVLAAAAGQGIRVRNRRDVALKGRSPA